LAGFVTPRRSATDGASDETTDHDSARVRVAVVHPPRSGSRRAESRYEMLRLHASGGLGHVWLARDRHLGREVALKEIRNDRAGSDVVADRFLAEARLTGQLEHPGIVPLYDLAH